MSRLTRFDADRAKARVQLYQLREKVLGVEASIGHHWSETLPPHPDSARERFLQICAVGGAEAFEAMLKGLVLRPLAMRNCWLVHSGDPDAPGGHYQLNLWIRPRLFTDLFGRQHTKQHCDAELHDSWGWSGYDKKGHRRRIRARIIYRGKVAQCLDHAKMLFVSWDAVTRLGGSPEKVAHL